VDAVTPLADVFKANKLRLYDDLPASRVASLDSALGAQAKGRTERAKGRGRRERDALRIGCGAAAVSSPYSSRVREATPQKAIEWKSHPGSVPATHPEG